MVPGKSTSGTTRIVGKRSNKIKREKGLFVLRKYKYMINLLVDVQIRQEVYLRAGKHIR